MTYRFKSFFWVLLLLFIANCVNAQLSIYTTGGMKAVRYSSPELGEIFPTGMLWTAGAKIDFTNSLFFTLVEGGYLSHPGGNEYTEKYLFTRAGIGTVMEQDAFFKLSSAILFGYYNTPWTNLGAYGATARVILESKNIEKLGGLGFFGWAGFEFNEVFPFSFEAVMGLRYSIQFAEGAEFPSFY